MADAPATGSSKKATDFLKQKIGPLPVVVWLGIGIVVVLYVKEKAAGGGLGSILGGSSSASSAVPNEQTDPAGNIGTIDPATGYVYGTPEDTAALAANNAGSTATTTTTTPGQQTYTDNNAWGTAAINYLVGLNIDATTANQAIQNYLTSQPLTTAQQGDVNLAIQALGPPPSLPGPVSSNPAPVTSPGSGTGTTTPGSASVTVPDVEGDTIDAATAKLATAGLKGHIPQTLANGTSYVINSQTPGAGQKVASGATIDLGVKIVSPGSTAKTGSTGETPAKKTTAAVPTGLVVAEKHATSLQVKWNKSANATGYHVLCTDMATKKVTNQFDTGSSQLYANCGGLTAGHSYVIDVWAEPEAGAVGSGPHAEVSTTLPKTG